MPVTGYAAGGKALGRLDGKVIFIDGAVPGDVADVLITKSKKDWAEGKATEIKKLSEERVIPFCIHFGTCGGCKWQMLPYEKQLQYKQQEVTEAFKRIGRLSNIDMLPVIGSANTIHYRNKLEFTFSNKKYISHEALQQLPQDAWPGGALGYHVPKLYDKILDIYECWLMDDENNAIRNCIRDFALKNNYSYYDIKEHTGWLRNIIIRKCTTGGLLVNIVFAHDDEAERKKICYHVLETVPAITTLLYTINGKWNDTIYDIETNVVFGSGYVIEKLEGLQFKISPKSFFQTNTKQAEQLYNVVKKFAALTGNEIVYDLYCGTGSIGIFLSTSAKKIIGVDVIEDAINDAKENAAFNNIDNAFFFCGDVLKICNNSFFAENGKPDVMVVDPPRAGLHSALIEKLIEIAPQKIIYVSCNVATQARDILILNEKYIVVKVQPVDMFPHTHHIECVAELRLRDVH